MTSMLAEMRRHEIFSEQREEPTLYSTNLGIFQEWKYKIEPRVPGMVFYIHAGVCERGYSIYFGSLKANDYNTQLSGMPFWYCQF